MRGRGLLAELERRARAIAMRRLVLETAERQHEAMAQYEGAGFARIACFGEYEHFAASVCMRKHPQPRHRRYGCRRSRPSSSADMPAS